MSQSFFREDVSIEREGRSITFTLAEQKALETRGNYWHGPGDPSSWLSVKTFTTVRSKHELSDEDALLLASLALGITREKLIGAIRWNDQYMAWHDGYDYPPTLDPSIK